MNRFLLSTSYFLLCAALASCGTTSFFAKAPELPANAPIAEAGKDLQTAVAMATQTYIEAKNGDVDFAWSIKKGLDAYKWAMATKADVQAIVKQWSDGSNAGKSFAEKIASLFALSTGDAEQKATALSNGVQTAALASPGP